MGTETFPPRHAQAVAERPKPAPLLVNERDARRLLGGLCSKTLYNLRRAGKLPAVKIGSRTMYDVSDLRAFVERQKGAGHE